MRKFRVATMCVYAVALASGAFAQQDVWEIDAAHSSAQFSVRHMMVSNVRGEFTKLSGKVTGEGKNLASARVEVTIDASTIDTHNEARDKHLKSADFFDVEKYPTLEFRSKRVEGVTDGQFRLIGDLTMHGVTKEIVLNVDGPTPEIKDQRGASRVGASATARINRKDFGLVWNRALDGGGVVVGDDVLITIDVELIKQAPAAK
jgi:polyisoprenoid-binding protein YceI